MQPIRGTRDLLFEDQRRFCQVTQAAQAVAEQFGFQKLSTPILETAALFHHTSGEASDLVSKEMFEVVSRGAGVRESSGMVLRPEGTAPVMRALLNAGLHQHLPVKAFYEGPMFRYDRPQKGRQRQFHQVGVEWIGDSDPMADVETIACAATFLEKLGLKDHLTLHLNTLGDTQSRDHHRNRLIAYFQRHVQSLSEESVKRLALNPLRILDSKDEGDKALVKDAPSILNDLTPQAAAFFEGVQQGLDQLGIAYHLDDALVRGLDYYSHTTFEFTTPNLGAQQTVLAGGRYDGLSQLMGGPAIAGVGWAAGIERLVLLQEQTGVPVPSRPDRIAILPIGKPCTHEALKLAQALRHKACEVEVLWGDVVLGKKLKKASKQGVATVLILGEEELAQHKVIMKDLRTGHQEGLSLNKLDKLVQVCFS